MITQIREPMHLSISSVKGLGYFRAMLGSGEQTCPEEGFEKP